MPLKALYTSSSQFLCSYPLLKVPGILKLRRFLLPSLLPTWLNQTWITNRDKDLNGWEVKEQVKKKNAPQAHASKPSHKPLSLSSWVQHLIQLPRYGKAPTATHLALLLPRFTSSRSWAGNRFLKHQTLIHTGVSIYDQTKSYLGPECCAVVLTSGQPGPESRATSIGCRKSVPWHVTASFFTLSEVYANQCQLIIWPNHSNWPSARAAVLLQML